MPVDGKYSYFVNDYLMPIPNKPAIEFESYASHATTLPLNNKGQQLAGKFWYSTCLLKRLFRLPVLPTGID